MKWRILLILVVASLIIPPLTGSALGAAKNARTSEVAELVSLRLAAQGSDGRLPDCMRFTVDATSGVKLPAPGKYDMVFRIYDAARRGRSLWKEDHVKVEVHSDRSLNVLLGCAGSPLRRGLWSGKPLWVEIQVVEDKPLDPLTPRIPLARVPYSYHSVYADQADHARSADNAETADQADATRRAERAERADYAVKAGTALEAEQAAEADLAVRAGRAEEADHAKSANSADTAGFAESAATAGEAVHAAEADSADRADYADEADRAKLAETAEHADQADRASRADVADHAKSAESADTASYAEIAATAGEAEHAEEADSADRADYADRARSAGTAQNADQAQYAIEAGQARDLACTACVDEDELSFDLLAQQEFDQPELEAALDGFQSVGNCSVGAPDWLICGAPLDEVPEGKTFIIEHVSAWVQTEPDHDPLVAILVESATSPPVRHFVDLEPVGANQPSADNQYWVANHPALAYAAGETAPHIECDVGAAGTCSVTVSGRLVEESADAHTFLQFSFQSAGDEPTNYSNSLSMPDGYMAVIEHMSARVRLDDSADIVHTIGVRIGEDPGDEIPDRGVSVVPIPTPGPSGIWAADPGEPEPPDPGEPPAPDPFAGAYTYRLTPTSPLLFYRTASEPILAYVNEGLVLTGICGHTLSTNVECTITVSGYLVEPPGAP